MPALGDVVYLRLTGNLSTGGTAIDVTDLVHPDNAEAAPGFRSKPQISVAEFSAA